jgi:hypothetical protein
MVPKILCGVTIASHEQTLKTGADFVFDLTLRKRIVWFTVNEVAESYLREVHSMVRTIVEGYPAKNWILLFWTEIRDFLRAHENLYEPLAESTETQVRVLLEKENRSNLASGR